MAIKRIGVVGSGIMGSGVAEVAAKSGFEVVLRSRAQETADAMLGGLDASLARQVKKGRLEESAAAEVRARVSAVTALDELAACDLVLESIVEDLAVKQELFGDLDRVCTPGAILATNTSTLPIVDMAMVTRAPRPGVWHPLLQPRAGDVAGRGRAGHHDVRRHPRRGAGLRRRRAARPR